MKISYLFIFVLLLFISSVTSLEESEYDYNEPFSYDSFDFYTSSDPSQWNWNNVDWTKVDFTRADLYTSDAFYSNLPSTSYSFLDYTKVDYSNPHFEHSFVNPEKYIKDVGCSGCLLDIKGLDKSQSVDGLDRYSLKEVRVRYSRDGITHEKGDFVSIPGKYPSGTQFSVLKDGIYVKVPSGTILNDISQKDSVILDTSKEGLYDKAKNKEGFSKETFNNVDYRGRKISGVISFKEGNLYLSSEQEAFIDDVRITPRPRIQDALSKISNKKEAILPSQIKLNIYFEDTVKVEPYILFEKEEKKVSIVSSSKVNPFTVSFYPGNPYIANEKSQKLLFETSGETRIDIEQREDLIPKVITSLSSDSKILLANGDWIYSLSSKPQFKVEAKSSAADAVPLTLLPLDRETGKNIYGDTSQKIIFDESKHVVLVADFLDERHLECVSCAFDLKSNDFLFYYNKDTLEEDIGAPVEFEGIKVDSDALLSAQVLENYNNLPEALKKNIKSLKIVPEAFMEGYCGSSLAKGCADPSNHQIIIAANLENSQLKAEEVIYHETAHTHTFNLEENDLSELKSYQIQLMRKYKIDTPPQVIFTKGDFSSYQPEEGLKPDYVFWKDHNGELEPKETERLLELASKSSEVPFALEWKKVAKDPYGKDLAPELVNGISVIWEDGTSEPRNGCTRAYGCNNYYEDVATFVEEISRKNYNFYKPLITPGSFTYDLRYRQKLDLLYKYGFIKEEDYKAIVEEK